MVGVGKKGHTKSGSTGFPNNRLHPLLELPSILPVLYRRTLGDIRVCTVIAMDQPGKVANPARGQLNRKNEDFPVPIRA